MSGVSWMDDSGSLMAYESTKMTMALNPRRKAEGQSPIAFCHQTDAPSITVRHSRHGHSGRHFCGQHFARGSKTCRSVFHGLQILPGELLAHQAESFDSRCHVPPKRSPPSSRQRIRMSSPKLERLAGLDRGSRLVKKDQKRESFPSPA